MSPNIAYTSRQIPRAWRKPAVDEPMPWRTYVPPQRDFIAQIKLLHLPFTRTMTCSVNVRNCLSSGGFC